MPRIVFVIATALLLVSATSQAETSPAERLAEAVRFKTISHQDRRKS